jgi:GTP-binding protein
MVGCIEYEDFMQISLADLPGILPDLTIGLGTRYLHHLERCKILIFVVDFSPPQNDQQIFEQYLNIRNVINVYDKDLLSRKSSIIVAHKIDQLFNTEHTNIVDIRLKEFKKNFCNKFGSNNLSDLLLIPVSAKKKINLNKFLILLRKVYENNKK